MGFLRAVSAILILGVVPMSAIKLRPSSSTKVQPTAESGNIDDNTSAVESHGCGLRGEVPIDNSQRETHEKENIKTSASDKQTASKQAEVHEQDDNNENEKETGAYTAGAEPDSRHEEKQSHHENKQSDQAAAEPNTQSTNEAMQPDLHRQDEKHAPPEQNESTQPIIKSQDAHSELQVDNKPTLLEKDDLSTDGTEIDQEENEQTDKEGEQVSAESKQTDDLHVLEQMIFKFNTLNFLWYQINHCEH